MQIFFRFKEITSIAISNSVMPIWCGAFRSCKSLATINSNGTCEEREQILKETYRDYDIGGYSVVCADNIAKKSIFNLPSKKQRAVL